MPKISQQKVCLEYSNSGPQKTPRVSLNLSDNEALRGPTTTDENGPLSVFVGSYNAINPHVPILIKFPEGTAQQLGFDFSQHPDFTIETYYCLQERVPSNPSDQFVSIRPHFAVFNPEEMKDAKRCKGQDKKILEEMREGIEAQIILSCQTENRSLPNKQELDSLVEAYMIANEAAPEEEQFASIDNAKNKEIQVAVFSQMNPSALLPLLDTGESNNYLVLHGGSVSPNNLHLESVQEKEKKSDYITSIVVVPKEKRILLTVHRVLSHEVIVKIENELHQYSTWDLETLSAKLKTFNLLELELLKQIVEKDLHQSSTLPIAVAQNEKPESCVTYSAIAPVFKEKMKSDEEGSIEQSKSNDVQKKYSLSPLHVDDLTLSTAKTQLEDLNSRLNKLNSRLQKKKKPGNNYESVANKAEALCMIVSPAITNFLQASEQSNKNTLKRLLEVCDIALHDKGTQNAFKEHRDSLIIRSMLSVIRGIIGIIGIILLIPGLFPSWEAYKDKFFKAPYTDSYKELSSMQDKLTSLAHIIDHQIEGKKPQELTDNPKSSQNHSH